MTRHLVQILPAFVLLGCIDTVLTDELNWPPDGQQAVDAGVDSSIANESDGSSGSHTRPPGDAAFPDTLFPDTGTGDTVAPWLVPAAGCTPSETLAGPLCLSSGPVGLALRLWASEPVTAAARLEPDGGVEARADELAPAHHLLLAPLQPDTAFDLIVEITDAAGLVATEGPIETRTAPLLAAVVINEVLYDPLGAEPTQEFVELFNAGRADLDLTGWTLADEGGADALAPPGPLRAGGYALVVADGYVPGAGGDPPPAAGTLMIVLGGSIGAQGLRNAGEALTLADLTGQVVAAAPAPLDQPHPGTSLERVSAFAPDGDPEVWCENLAGRSTPGAANSVAAGP